MGADGDSLTFSGDIATRAERLEKVPIRHDIDSLFTATRTIEQPVPDGCARIRRQDCAPC